jgi:hypothetical protein
LFGASVVGSSMIVVDALDDRAVRFYEAHGLIRLVDSKRLVLPMQTLASLMSQTALSLSTVLM